MEGKRLSKALAAAGVASRRACETLIFEGRVAVNGTVVRKPEFRVDWERDQLTVDGVAISSEQEKLYFLLNKPEGYLCTNARPAPTARIVLDLFSGISQRLFTIGRLDRETTGLLLVTNDGAFAQRVIHPSAGIEKEYLFKVVEELTDTHLKCLSKGMFIDRHWVKPLWVKKIRHGTGKICVREGRKHEVRLLVSHAKLHLFHLKRIRIGKLLLGPLQEGSYRPCTARDKKLIFGGEASDSCKNFAP